LESKGLGSESKTDTQGIAERDGPNCQGNDERELMATTLPADEVLMEQAIRSKMKDTLFSVPMIQDIVKNVYTRYRFSDSDKKDQLITTIPDLVAPDFRLTSVIEIGEAEVSEAEYTGDTSTTLTLIYPFEFTFTVVDQWDNSDQSLEFDNSTDFVTAVYFRARRKFKFNRTLGYENCVHNYLQRDYSGPSEGEDTDGGPVHIQNWSLTVKATGVNV
jgi:hypothetical protein